MEVESEATGYATGEALLAEVSVGLWGISEIGVIRMVVGYAEGFLRFSMEAARFYPSVHVSPSALTYPAVLALWPNLRVGDVMYVPVSGHNSTRVVVAHDATGDGVNVGGGCADMTCALAPVNPAEKKWNWLSVRITQHIQDPVAFYFTNRPSVKASVRQRFERIELDTRKHQHLLRRASGGRSVPHSISCYWDWGLEAIMIRGPLTDDFAGWSGVYKHHPAVRLSATTHGAYFQEAKLAWPNDPIMVLARNQNRANLDELLKKLPSAKLGRTRIEITNWHSALDDETLRDCDTRNETLSGVALNKDGVPSKVSSVWFKNHTEFMRTILSERGPYGGLPVYSSLSGASIITKLL